MVAFQVPYLNFKGKDTEDSAWVYLVPTGAGTGKELAAAYEHHFLNVVLPYHEGVKGKYKEPNDTIASAHFFYGCTEGIEALQQIIIDAEKDGWTYGRLPWLCKYPAGK
jgi:hypothetical protein